MKLTPKVRIVRATDEEMQLVESIRTNLEQVQRLLEEQSDGWPWHDEVYAYLERWAEEKDIDSLLQDMNGSDVEVPLDDAAQAVQRVVDAIDALESEFDALAAKYRK